MFNNNLWNHIFHAKAVNRLQLRSIELRNAMHNSPGFLARIGSVSFSKDSSSVKITGAQTLSELLNIHKEIWDSGFQNDNLGPNPHGMFRSNGIPDIAEEEVFLGSKDYGIEEMSISEWEKYKDKGESLDNNSHIKPYLIVLQQYKKLLSSNVTMLLDAFSDEYMQLTDYGYGY